MIIKKLRDRKWLYYQYIEKDLSISDIAKVLFGKVSKRTTIYNWLKKHKIKRRGFSGHKNQLLGVKGRIGKYTAWNKGTHGVMPSPWNKGKGKRFMIDKNGYKWLLIGKENPLANKLGYVAEHRLVMAKILGRPLHRKEMVHHKNKDRKDNSEQNLMLIEIGKPNAHKITCPKCLFSWMIK